MPTKNKVPLKRGWTTDGRKAYQTDSINMVTYLGITRTMYALKENNGQWNHSDDPADFLEIITDATEIIRFAAWLKQEGKL